MTREEEIKHAAQEYINSDAVIPENMYLAYGDFINGARWADEHPQFVHTDNSQVIANLEAEIERLKNPWISVEERLPEVGLTVLTNILQIIDGGGEHNESTMVLVQLFHGKWDTNRMEQQRVGGILFDTISVVTHWMPIPELEKGE